MHTQAERANIETIIRGEVDQIGRGNDFDPGPEFNDLSRSRGKLEPMLCSQSHIRRARTNPNDLTNDVLTGTTNFSDIE